MTPGSELGLVAFVITGIAACVYELLRRAERLPPRLSLALRLAAHESAVRGHAQVGDVHVLYALLHDREATMGVVDETIRASWLRAIDETLARLPRAARAVCPSRDFSPFLDDAIRRATGAPQVSLPDLLRRLLALPDLAAVRRALDRAPARFGESEAYRAAKPIAGGWQVRLWDDPLVSAADFESALGEIGGVRGTQATFHWFELQLVGSTVVGPLDEAEARALVEHARSRAPGRRPLVTIEARGLACPSWAS